MVPPRSLLIEWLAVIRSLNTAPEALVKEAPPPLRRLPPVQSTVPLLVIARKLKSWALAPEIVSVAPAAMEAVEAVLVLHVPPDQVGVPVSASEAMDVMPAVWLNPAKAAAPAPASVPPLRVKLDRLSVPAAMLSVP